MLDGCRIEKKYVVSLGAAAILRQRLAPFMEADPQAVGGAYRIRSLYFDTPEEDAFWEKFDGEADYYSGAVSNMNLYHGGWE